MEEKKNENIKDMSSAEIKTDKGNIYCLTIIGQIEGHMLLPPQNKTTKYEHILPLLVSIEESEETDGLFIILNTMGGDVEAGLAIAEMISGMKKPTVSLVLGGVIEFVGEEAFAGFIAANPTASVFASALVGLIPNCAVSVAGAKLYLAGAMSPGALMASSFTGSGLGLLVLFRTNRNVKENLAILLSVYVAGVVLGFLTGYRL